MVKPKERIQSENSKDEVKDVELVFCIENNIHLICET